MATIKTPEFYAARAKLADARAEEKREKARVSAETRRATKAAQGDGPMTRDEAIQDVTDIARLAKAKAISEKEDDSIRNAIAAYRVVGDFMGLQKGGAARKEDSENALKTGSDLLRAGADDDDDRDD